MKYNYNLHPLFALILPLMLLLSGCGDDEKKTDPKPVMHTVMVHYSASGLFAGLGARVSVESTSPQGTNSSYYFSRLDQPSYNTTLPAYTYPSDHDFIVTVSFANLGPFQSAPSGSFIKAEILVDNYVRKTVTIDHNTAPGSPYMTASAKILASEW